MTEKEIDEIWKEFDINNDGQLDFKEVNHVLHLHTFHFDPPPNSHC